MALTGLGHIARMQGATDEAQAMYEQAIANYEAARTTDSSSADDRTRMEQYSRFGITINLVSLGSLALDRHDYAAARRLGDDALSVARDLRDDALLVNGLQLLGAVDELQGELEAARRTFTESVELSRQLPYAQGLVRGLEGLARLAMAEGEPERGLRLHAAAAAHGEAIGIPVNWTAEWAARGSHLFATARQALGEAAAEAAVAAGRALSLEQAVQEALERVAPTPGPQLPAASNG
jgi:tetratricopeptide (TPR) repeat protein